MALAHFDAYGLAPRDLLSARQQLEFVRRWNFLRHKLRRASVFLSLHNHDAAMYVRATNRPTDRLTAHADAHTRARAHARSPPETTLTVSPPPSRCA